MQLVGDHIRMQMSAVSGWFMVDILILCQAWLMFECPGIESGSSTPMDSFIGTFHRDCILCHSDSWICIYVAFDSKQQLSTVLVSTCGRQSYKSTLNICLVFGLNFMTNRQHAAGSLHNALGSSSIIYKTHK